MHSLQMSSKDGENYSSFGTRYAGVYDALYREKNYAAEARFALDQIRAIVAEPPCQILDLGCGTGLHAVEFARTGILVTGVDRSADMIAVAENRRGSLSKDLSERLRFSVGDIRQIDLHGRYDAVVSLFHVISYVVENNDLKATLEIVRQHLKPGGAFIFDFWYGPAVIRNPPQSRVKSTWIGKNYVQRRASPEWDRERCVVCVNYELEMRNSASGETTRQREQHVVRYLFCDELKEWLAICGFEIVRFGEWLTDNPPSDSTFSVYALAKAK
jgi:SAM-dependent methyltransferase